MEKVLLIVLKKLWIDNIPTEMLTKSSNQNKGNISIQDIHAKFEFYLGSQNLYTPLVRKDTVFHLTRLLDDSDYDDKIESKLPFLCYTLEKMVESINYQAYEENSITRKEMSIEEIENYNKKMINTPLLKQEMKQGIFLTIEEFKNNLPSITSFTKRKLKRTNLIELRDKNERVILHYFAFYDGTNLQRSVPLFLLSKILPPNYNRVYRVGNSFQFYEMQVVNNPVKVGLPTQHQSVPDIHFNIDSRTVYSIPRQIDLETGEIY